MDHIICAHTAKIIYVKKAICKYFKKKQDGVFNIQNSMSKIFAKFIVLKNLWVNFTKISIRYFSLFNLFVLLNIFWGWGKRLIKNQFFIYQGKKISKLFYVTVSMWFLLMLFLYIFRVPLMRTLSKVEIYLVSNLKNDSMIV